jgi:hypothetical protein
MAHLGKQPGHLLALALRAGNPFLSHDQNLEILATGFAVVFKNRHLILSFQTIMGRV